MSVELHPRFFFDESGQPQLVLLSYAEYAAMLEELHDHIDSEILAERVKNAGQAIPLRDVMFELDGVRE